MDEKEIERIDDAIRDHIKQKYNLNITHSHADEIRVGLFGQGNDPLAGHPDLSMRQNVLGRDADSGIPQQIIVTAEELFDAFYPDRKETDD